MSFSSSPAMTMPNLVHLIPIFFMFSTIHSALDCYQSIFSFGDSLADTGNALQEGYRTSSRFPYGETFFHRATGRYSDGRLIVDLFAQELGVPFLPPYLGFSGGGEDFRRGVNFAVGGATALDKSFFEERGIDNKYTNSTLRVQLGWFKDLLPSLCSQPSECRDFLGRSLFLVGEIGGNDYNHPFFQGRSLEEIKTFVPFVIDAIGSAIQSLIESGALILVVPGNLPIGCSPAYLTVFESPNEDDYDPQTGCLTYLNSFAEYHNLMLQKELHRLRRIHPQATILYADYYNAAMPFYRAPHQYGFISAITACCGGGGSYNYNQHARCSYRGFLLCSDPSAYVSWDGIHLTEAAYKWVFDGMMNGPNLKPSIRTACFKSLDSVSHPYQK